MSDKSYRLWRQDLGQSPKVLMRKSPVNTGFFDGVLFSSKRKVLVVEMYMSNPRPIELIISCFLQYN